MFERVNEQAGTSATLHSLRHTAAYRMAEDSALPLTDVQFVLGHAQLTTTKIYLTPRKEEVIRAGAGPSCRADPASGCADPSFLGARVPAGDAGRAVPERRIMTATKARPGLDMRALPTPRSGTGALPGPPGACVLARDRSVPRAAGGPAGREPFVVGNAYTEKIRRRGLAFLLDWLEDQPGTTWQERWLASGSDAAGTAWRERPAAWLRDRARTADWRLNALGSSLLTLISADVVRPALSLPAVKATGPGSLVRHLARARDPEVCAALRAFCEADPHVLRGIGQPHPLPGRGDRRGQGRRDGGYHCRRRPGTAGHRARGAGRDARRCRGVLPADARHGHLRAGRAGDMREIRSLGQRTPEELIGRYRLDAVLFATFWWTTSANASPRWTTRA